MNMEEVQELANELDRSDDEWCRDPNADYFRHCGKVMKALIEIANGAHSVLDIAHRIDSPAAKQVRLHLEIPFRQLDRLRP